MKLHVILRTLFAVLAASLMLARPALAITVFDPTNLLQNKLTAIRTLEQINNQIKQLQNEGQMLRNQSRNLASLDFNIVNRLRFTLANTDRLIAEARGLAYNVQTMDANLARLYPQQYAAAISGDQMHRDAQERWQNRQRAAAALGSESARPAPGESAAASTATQGSAPEDDAPASATSQQQPAWAKRLHRRQQIAHAATTAAQTLRAGDGGGSGGGPSLDDADS